MTLYVPFLAALAWLLSYLSLMLSSFFTTNILLFYLFTVVKISLKCVGKTAECYFGEGGVPFS